MTYFLTFIAGVFTGIALLALCVIQKRRDNE